MRLQLPVLLAFSALALAGCQDGAAPARENASGDVPDSLKAERLTDDVVQIEGTTPMADRVAVLGLLNKRNGLTQDLEMQPGEARRVGNVVIQLRACETTPPWESPPETGAFVRLFVANREEKMQRVFSGWLFQKRPERNVIEHPVYDVYVKACTMTFPGVPSSSAENDG